MSDTLAIGPALAALEKNGNSKPLESLLRSSLDKWKDTQLKIGVTGRSGVGKSSLINTLRGITGECPEAAETGVIETTREAKAFSHPDNKNLVFWDLPGIGTSNFPRETYFKDERVQFDRYDMFLILSADRFFQDDYLLAAEAQKSDKPFFFIRTKVDCAINSMRTAKPLLFKTDENATEKLLGQVRDEIMKEMRANSSITADSVFLVNCLDIEWNSFDFGKLISRLIDGFRDLQREAFVLTLNVRQAEVLDQKVAFLRGRIWKVSLRSAIGAAVPVPGLSIAVDAAAIHHETSIYMDQLGISKEHIEKASRRFSMDVNEFKASMNLKSFAISWTLQGIIKYIAESAISKTTAQTVLKIVPLVGSAIASGISYRSTYAFLDNTLTMMASDAKMFHRELLKKAIPPVSSL